MDNLSYIDHLFFPRRGHLIALFDWLNLLFMGYNHDIDSSKLSIKTLNRRGSLSESKIHEFMRLKKEDLV